MAHFGAFSAQCPTMAAQLVGLKPYISQRIRYIHTKWGMNFHWYLVIHWHPCLRMNHIYFNISTKNLKSVGHPLSITRAGMIAAVC